MHNVNDLEVCLYALVFFWNVPRVPYWRAFIILKVYIGLALGCRRKVFYAPVLVSCSSGNTLGKTFLTFVISKPIHAISNYLEIIKELFRNHKYSLSISSSEWIMYIQHRWKNEMNYWQKFSREWYNASSEKFLSKMHKTKADSISNPIINFR